MPWQLVYTSVPRGYVAGQSGFCTVARTPGMREALATRLEQLSSYDHLTLRDSPGGPQPIVAAHRILDLRGTRYHVLTRILDAGLDFTKRTNHLAHHLVLQLHEIEGLPSPARILRHWNGWLSQWSGEPRSIEESATGNLHALGQPGPCLPARAWARETGDAGRAAALLEPPCDRGCFLEVPAGREETVLELFDESLQLLDPRGQSSVHTWRITFTTFLQGADHPGDFQWRGCRPGAPACETARKSGLPILNLYQLPVPQSDLAELARAGRREEPALNPTSVVRARLALRREPAPPRVPTQRATMAEPRENEGRAGKGETSGAGNHRGRWVLIGSIVLLIVAGGLVAWLAPALPARIRAWIEQAPAGAEARVSPDPSSQTDPAASMPTGDALSNQATDANAKALPSAESVTLPRAILFLDNGKPMRLPPLPELESLCQRLAAPNASLVPADVQAGIGPPVLTTEFATSLNAVNADLNAKRLWIEAGPGARVTIDFQRAFRQAGEPLVLEIPTDLAAQGCVLEFRERGAESASGSLRLALLNPASAPQPVIMDRRWLRNEATNALDQLEPPLRARIEGVALSPPWQWALRPYCVISNREGLLDLFARWPANDVRPLATADFRKLREFYATRCRALREDVERLETQVEEVSSSLGAGSDFNPNFPLGRVLGAPTNSPVFSFARYLDAFPEHRPSGQVFIEYVASFLRAAEPDLKNAKELLRDLNNPATRTNTLAQIEPLLGIVARIRGQPATPQALPPAGYFVAGWEALRALDGRRTELESARTSLAFLEERLAQLPAGLVRTAHISLVAERGRQSVEIVRFVEAPGSDAP